MERREFLYFLAPEGRKVGSLGPWVRSQLLKNACCCGVNEPHFQVKNRKQRSSGPFWKLTCRKKIVVVVQCTFPTQREHTPQCRTISGSLRCYKNKRRCLAKHFSKWKCRPLFAKLLWFDMSRKHMPLSNKIHFEVKIWKPARFQFWRFKCFVSSTHYITSYHTPPPRNNTALHHTQHYSQIHNTAPPSIHYTALPSATLHHVIHLHPTKLQPQQQLHSHTPYSTAQNYTTFQYPSQQ